MRALPSYADADLLSAIRSGDQIDKAIGFIYRTHYRMLENYVVTNSGSVMDAEDLVQEVLVVFIELVQNGKYRGEASVKSFLYTLARNLWITELRKRNSDAKRNDYFETNRDTVEDSVADFLIYKESQHTITALFAKLNETCQRILTLFYYDNLSMKEILEQTNYENEQVVRNRKYKCLKELTDLIRQTPAIYDNVKAALQRTR